jgi:hypothetical protein
VSGRVCQSDGKLFTANGLIQYDLFGRIFLFFGRRQAALILSLGGAFAGSLLHNRKGHQGSQRRCGENVAFVKLRDLPGYAFSDACRKLDHYPISGGLDNWVNRGKIPPI